MNYILNNNDLVIYTFCTISICLITGFIIKSYFYSTVIQTPNSPQTFNFTLDQLKEIEGSLDKENIWAKSPQEIDEILQRGGVLPPEVQVKLDEDLENMMGKENYADLQRDMQLIDNEFAQALLEIFN